MSTGEMSKMKMTEKYGCKLLKEKPLKNYFIEWDFDKRN